MTQNVYVKMLEATPVSKQAKVHELIAKHMRAKGDLGYLEALLTLAGTFNPIDAFDSLRLKKVDFNRNPILDTEHSTDKRRVHVPIATTERAKRLVHGAIYLTSSNNPTQSLIIGFDAFNKLNNVFGFSNVEALTQKKTEREKKKASLEEKTRREFAKQVSEIKQGLKELTDIQSIYERQEVQTLLDFDSAIENAMKLMGTLVLNQEFYVNGNFANLFSSRGTLLTGILNDPVVPPEIKTFATELLDINIQLPQDEYIKKFNLVRTYKAMTTPINTKVVLGHYFDDLKYINSLPDSYFENENLPRPNSASIADLVDSKTTTLLNAGRVENLGIQDIRLDIANKLLHMTGQFNEDYFTTLTKTRFLFREGDSWKLKGVKSVPLRSDFKDYFFTAILNQHELRLLMDVQYTLFASQDDTKKFIASNSIANFKTYANQLVVIRRKLQYLQQELNKKEELSKKNDSKVLTKDPSGNLVKHYKDWFRNDRLGEFLPVEYFQQEFGLSLQELSLRWDDVQNFIKGGDDSLIRMKHNALEQEAKKGYLKKESIDDIATVYSFNGKKLFKGLADLEELTDEDQKNISDIVSINKSPLTRTQLFVDLSRRYLLPKEKGKYTGYHQVKYKLDEAIKDKDLQEVEKTVEIYSHLLQTSKGRYTFSRDSYRIRSQTWIIDGKVDDNNQLTASKETINKKDYETNEQGLSYITKEGYKKLEEKINTLLPIDETLLDRIKFLAHNKNYGLMRSKGVEPISSKEWSTMQNAQAGDYISIGFAQTLVGVYNQITS